jgi:hypothetical protein
MENVLIEFPQRVVVLRSSSGFSPWKGEDKTVEHWNIAVSVMLIVQRMFRLEALVLGMPVDSE